MKRTVATLSAVSLLGLAVACSPPEHSGDAVAEAEKTSPEGKRSGQTPTPTVEREERLRQDFSTLLESSPTSPQAIQPLATMSLAGCCRNRMNLV